MPANPKRAAAAFDASENLLAWVPFGTNELVVSLLWDAPRSRVWIDGEYTGGTQAAHRTTT